MKFKAIKHQKLICIITILLQLTPVMAQLRKPGSGSGGTSTGNPDSLSGHAGSEYALKVDTSSIIQKKIPNILDSTKYVETAEIIPTNIGNASILQSTTDGDSVITWGSADSAGYPVAGANVTVTKINGTKSWLISATGGGGGANPTGNTIADSLANSTTTRNYRSIYQHRYFTWFFDDFEAGASNSSAFSNGWTMTAINSGSATLGSIGGLHNSDSLYMGMLIITTGTNTAGGCVLNRGNSQIVPGNGLLQFETLVRIPVLPSAVGAGGEQFHFDIGFSDKIDATEYTDAVVFRIDSLSTQWKCVTISNGTADTASVGSAVVADQMYRLRADINAYTARYYINDILVRTVTSATAVPNGIARVFSPHIRIIKLGGTATARTAEIDYFYYDKVFTASR